MYELAFYPSCDVAFRIKLIINRLPRFALSGDLRYRLIVRQ